MLARLQVRHVYPILPVALFVVAASGPIRDNSFLWHVRAGSTQLESTHVLATDPFSYSAGGGIWRTQSWLAELLYAECEALFGGVSWSTVLVGMVGMAILGITGLSVHRHTGSTFVTTVWLLLATWLLAPFNQPRPVVFSYLLLAALVLTLDLEERIRWAVVPIIWVWAGIHGSWTIGLGLVVLVAISRRSNQLVVAGLIAALMTAATAHGAGTWGIVLSFARNSGALEYMQEWQVPDFGSVVLGPFLFVLAALLVAAIKGKIAMSDLWIILPFAMLALGSRRLVPVAVIVLVPIASRSVRTALPTRKKGSPVIPWVVLAAIIVGTVLVSMRPHDVLDVNLFPSDAAIAAVGQGRFFHDDIVGGYLIYSDGPSRRVYIDDRVELYGETFFAEFIAAREGDYHGLFERFGMTGAIVRPDWPLRRRLLEDGWRIVFTDAAVEVMVPGHSPGWPASVD